MVQDGEFIRTFGAGGWLRCLAPTGLRSYGLTGFVLPASEMTVTPKDP